MQRRKKAAPAGAAPNVIDPEHPPEARRRNGILRAGWAELYRLGRAYEIESAHVARLIDAVSRSRVLRDLLESPPPGPCRAWLCFVALVDAFVDPHGGPGQLPPPLMHPPRLRVP